MKIPQFLYVPRINTLGDDKIIIETRVNAYWLIIEHENLKERGEWWAERQSEIENSKALTINFHNRYPITLICIGVKGDVTNERLIKLGGIALDWYVQFYFSNKNLTTPILSDVSEITDEIRSKYKHWVWGDNIVSNKELLYLINLEHGVSIRFDYADAFFASFEDFENSIADVQFLSGHRPDEETVNALIVDAWNFMGIQERLEDGFGLEDLGEVDI